LSATDKDHEALYSSYSIALSAYLCDLHIVFLVLLNWLGLKTSETTTFARTLHLPFVKSMLFLHINHLNESQFRNALKICYLWLKRCVQGWFC
jgi:hypothetical protein